MSPRPKKVSFIRTRYNLLNLSYLKAETNSKFVLNLLSRDSV